MKTTRQKILEQQSLNRKIWAKDNGRMHHIDANKMIAEFMGARPITFTDKTKGHSFWKDEGIEGRYGAFPDGSSNYFDYDKGYHTSWEWLMPVVKKCFQTGDDTYEWDNIMDTLFTCDRDIVYAQVVEFINQYNKTK